MVSHDMNPLRGVDIVGHTLRSVGKVTSLQSDLNSLYQFVVFHVWQTAALLSAHVRILSMDLHVASFLL